MILASGHISTILLLDFSTIFVTVACTLLARRAIHSQVYSSDSRFWADFLKGFQIVYGKKRHLDF